MTKTNEIMQRMMMMAVLVTGLFFVSANPAIAQHKAFFLIVTNGDTIPVKISFQDGPCYQGGTDRNAVWNVAPGKSIRVHVQRNNISQCGGKQGEFGLIFEPKVDGNKLQKFNFDNNGVLNAPQHFNHYPGKLKKYDNRDYIYTTAKTRKVTPGVSVGRWEFLCSRACTAWETTTSITDQTNMETTKSSTTRKALSVSMEAGIKLKGVVSLKNSIKGEYEKTHSQSMSNSILTMKSKEAKLNMKEFTLKWMSENNVKAIWQWVVTTDLIMPNEKKEEITVKTKYLTCTSDANEPKYYPGSQKHLDACQK